MPAPLELAGSRLGRLTVLGREGDCLGREAAWRVRCDCGRVETYPQRRLTETARRGLARACNACSAPPCTVCGGPVDRPPGSSRTTCSEGCRIARSREVGRDYHHRAAADPAKRPARLARVARRHAERMASDPAYAAAQRERDRARTRALNADPALRERVRRQGRETYARNRDAVQERRRSALAALDADGLARWMDQMRAYGRAYRARWRADLAADPDRHRAYLDLQAEYRRQQRLQRLMAEASRVIERRSA